MVAVDDAKAVAAARARAAGEAPSASDLEAVTSPTRGRKDDFAAADTTVELLERKGASSAGCDVSDCGDGTYALSALATTAGRYTVHCFVDGRPAMAPWPFIVKPGVPDASTSELSVGGTKGVVGRWVPLQVVARDMFGNIADGASLGAPSAAGQATGLDGGIEVHVVGGEGRAMPLQPVGEGRYESAVVSPVAGLLKVSVTIGGMHLRGSPFELHVNAGRSAASQSFAEGTGWQRRVLVGQKVAFTIHAFDAQGNPQNRPTDAFRITMTPRARGNHAQQLRPAYLGGGTTLVEYTIEQPGSYVLSATLKGYHIRDSPFNLVAGSGTLPAATSRLCPLPIQVFTAF